MMFRRFRAFVILFLSRLLRQTHASSNNLIIHQQIAEEWWQFSRLRQVRRP